MVSIFNRIYFENIITELCLNGKVFFEEKKSRQVNTEPGGNTKILHPIYA